MFWLGFGPGRCAGEVAAGPWCKAAWSGTRLCWWCFLAYLGGGGGGGGGATSADSAFPRNLKIPQEPWEWEKKRQNT